LPPLTANVDEHGSAANVLADDLFQLRLEHGVGLGAADRHFQVAVVDGADLYGQSQGVTLEVGLAKPGHAQEQAAGTPRGRRARAGAYSACRPIVDLGAASLS